MGPLSTVDTQLDTPLDNVARGQLIRDALWEDGAVDVDFTICYNPHRLFIVWNRYFCGQTHTRIHPVTREVCRVYGAMAVTPQSLHARQLGQPLRFCNK